MAANNHNSHARRELVALTKEVQKQQAQVLSLTRQIQQGQQGKGSGKGGYRAPTPTPRGGTKKVSFGMAETWNTARTQGECGCCGSSEHSRRDCTKTNEDCNYCGKRGHLAKVCRHRLRDQGTRSPSRGRGQPRRDQRRQRRSQSPQQRERNDPTTTPQQPDTRRWYCTGCTAWRYDKSRCNHCGEQKPKKAYDDNLVPKDKKLLSEVQEQFGQNHKDEEELSEASDDTLTSDNQAEQHSLTDSEDEGEEETKELRIAKRTLKGLITIKADEQTIEATRKKVKDLERNPIALQASRAKQKVVRAEVQELEQWAAQKQSMQEKIDRLTKEKADCTKALPKALEAEAEEHRQKVEEIKASFQAKEEAIEEQLVKAQEALAKATSRHENTTTQTGETIELLDNAINGPGGKKVKKQQKQGLEDCETSDLDLFATEGWVEQQLLEHACENDQFLTIAGGQASKAQVMAVVHFLKNGLQRHKKELKQLESMQEQQQVAYQTEKAKKRQLALAQIHRNQQTFDEAVTRQRAEQMRQAEQAGVVAVPGTCPEASALQQQQVAAGTAALAEAQAAQQQQQQQLQLEQQQLQQQQQLLLQQQQQQQQQLLQQQQLQQQVVTVPGTCPQSSALLQAQPPQ